MGHELSISLDDDVKWEYVGAQSVAGACRHRQLRHALHTRHYELDLIRLSNNRHIKHDEHIFYYFILLTIVIN